MNDAWSGFEHRIWKNLTEPGFVDEQAFLLCVSGGLDSVAMFEIMLRLKPKSKFRVLCYHHGDSDDQNLVQFRDRSLESVKKKAKEAGVDFLSERSQKQLRSENDFREARWNFINAVKAIDEVVVTAHHLNDSLETMLMKMIRGTSTEGISAFKMWNGQIFRPFLNVTKKQILEYAHERNLFWLDDPTNTNTEHLRNWVREKWLKDLERRSPGGVENMALSLQRIIEASTENQAFELEFAYNSIESGLSRVWFSSLSKFDQVRALSIFLKKYSIRDFTTGQLEEIRKRLDKNQKELTFQILGRKWVINASQIMLQ